MRNQRTLTILTTVLSLLVISGALHAAPRKKQAVTPASSKSTKPPVRSSAKPSSASASKTAAKRSTAKRRTTTVARQRMPTAPTPARISEIQSALADQGAYEGAPSGKWDANTISAMEHFQSANGLTPTGKLDAPTLEKLGLGSQTSGVAAPMPLPHASTNLLLPSASSNSSANSATSAQSQNP